MSQTEIDIRVNWEVPLNFSPALQKKLDEIGFFGIIKLKYLPHCGWIVHSFTAQAWTPFITVWPATEKSPKLLSIGGSFSIKPRRGMFCKSPHKLMSRFNEKAMA